MLFNCLHCGRTISTCIETCPFCKQNIVEVASQLTGHVKREKKAVKDHTTFKNTIYSFIAKPSK